jgi:hypothetical protein
MSVDGCVIEMRGKEEGHRSREIIIEDDGDNNMRKEDEGDVSSDDGNSKADNIKSESADHI